MFSYFDLYCRTTVLQCRLGKTSIMCTIDSITLLYRHLVIPLVFINKVGTICQLVVGIT